MPPDRDLDGELRDLGPRVEYPPTPDLAGSVKSRLEAEADGADPPARSRPQVWWIAAAALVLLVSVPVFALAMREMGGDASSASRGAAGSVAESGGQESGAGPTRLTEEEAAGPTHAAGNEGDLAVGAGGGAPSSRAAESEVSPAADSACGWPEPSLKARPARGAPGEEFGIRGYFEADVRDCDLDPARAVRVEFLQDGGTWDLGSVDASKNSRLAAKLKVPASARPGRATVRATYEQRSPEDPHGKTSAEARFFVLE